MMSKRTVFVLKALFLSVNALAAGTLMWGVDNRFRLLVLVFPLACAACLRFRALLPHLLAALGAGLVFFGYQSYSVQAQVLHYLVSLSALTLLAASGPDRDPPPYGPLRLWLLGFVGVMLAGLPLLPLGEFAQALSATGPLGFIRMAAYTVARSSFYSLAAMDRLALYALFAWELSRLRDESGGKAFFFGVAASLPALLAFGLAEFFLARGKAYVMNDRLTSLFLNPGWLGEYVCMGFPFLFLLGRGRRRWLLYPLLAVTLAAMVLTMARAAWMISGALAVACVVLELGRFDLCALHYRRMGKGALLGVAAVAMVALAVYGFLAVTRISLLNFPLATMIAQRFEKFTQSPRPVVFESGLLVGMESPVSGMGYESYAWHYRHLMSVPASELARHISPDAEMFEATHNLYIQIFTGGGALGLLAWLFLAGRAFQLALRRHRLRADSLSLAVFFALAAFHVFGLFQEMIYIPAVWLLFFAVLAWCLRMEDLEGGWVADFTERRAGRVVALGVLAALALNLGNAGFAATAARLGLAAYPAPADQDIQGLSGPETVQGRSVLWSSGSSSFLLEGDGPWTFQVGATHPDLAAKPVLVTLKNTRGEAATALLDEKTGRAARLTMPAGAARPGDRVYLLVSRLYCPVSSGLKDHRALGVWISGPGLDGRIAGAASD